MKSLIAGYRVNPIADLEPAGRRQNFVGCQVERTKYQTERLIFNKGKKTGTRCPEPTGSPFAQNRVPQNTHPGLRTVQSDQGQFPLPAVLPAGSPALENRGIDHEPVCQEEWEGYLRLFRYHEVLGKWIREM